MHTIHNPELIPPELIYKYDRKTNQTWNIPEYKVPREYLDPALQVKEREWATQKKAQKDRKKKKKRGFYMDYDLKIASGIPGSSNHYLIQINMEKISHGLSKNFQPYQKIEKWIKN